MAVNYPYYSPNPYPGVPQPPRPVYVEQPQALMKGHPVSSLEEARATSIDFDGSIFYFPDIANKKIYTKQINIDGTSTLNVYELKNIPIEPVINPAQFITREEFETTLGQLKSELKQPVQEQKKEAPKLDF